MAISIDQNDAELRSMIERILDESPQTQFEVVIQRIASEFATESSRSYGGAIQMFPQSQELSNRDRVRVHDILWDLIIEGKIRPGSGNGIDNNLPFIHVRNRIK